MARQRKSIAIVSAAGGRARGGYFCPIIMAYFKMPRPATLQLPPVVGAGQLPTMPATAVELDARATVAEHAAAAATAAALPPQLAHLVPVAVPAVHTAERTVATPTIPVPADLATFAKLDKYEPRGMHEFFMGAAPAPIVWAGAEGHTVWDRHGNRWLDFTGAIISANAGHSNPRIVAALEGQLASKLIHSYSYATEVRAEYVEYLVEHTPPQFEKAFLCSAGTEALENALKVMRASGSTAGKRRLGTVGFAGNYHGRTMGAIQMAGGRQAGNNWVGPSDGQDMWTLPWPLPEGVNGAGPEAVADPAAFFEASMAALLQREGLDPEKDLCGMVFETFQVRPYLGKEAAPSSALQSSLAATSTSCPSTPTRLPSTWHEQQLLPSFSHYSPHQGWGAWFYPVEFVHAAVGFCRRHGLANSGTVALLHPPLTFVRLFNRHAERDF